MALHNLTTPVMAVVAVDAVVAATLVAGLGGLAPTAQKTLGVCGKKQLCKKTSPLFVILPFFPMCKSALNSFSSNQKRFFSQKIFFIFFAERFLVRLWDGCSFGF